jgi:hypothetical protein
MAEGEGFEPPVPCGTPVFKTGAFNHSATPPTCYIIASYDTNRKSFFAFEPCLFYFWTEN